MSSSVVVPKLLICSVAILFSISAGLLVHRLRAKDHRTGDKPPFSWSTTLGWVKVAGSTYALLLLLVGLLLVGEQVSHGQADVDPANLGFTFRVALLLSTALWAPFFSVAFGWKLGRTKRRSGKSSHWVAFWGIAGCLVGVLSAAEIVYFEDWGLASSFEDVTTGYFAICVILGLSFGLAGYAKGPASRL